MAGLAGAAHATNLVVDGDFNSPWGGVYTTYYAGSSFGPWNVTSGSVDLIGSYWQSPTAGGGSVDMDGNSPGAIDQTLNLTAGTYVLTFDLSGNPDGAPVTKTLDVSVGSASEVFTYTLGPDNHENNMLYTPESLIFTATGPTTLTFASGDVDSPYGAAIGGVSVTAVPEPAAWSLMIAGLGFIGAGLRVGRKSARAGLTVA
jgi:choice-of-anchor C domain-containing protein